MSKKQAAGGITAIFGGAYYLFAGFLDPTFWLFSIETWYPFAKIFARSIGPMVAPSVSWQRIGSVLAVLFLIASLAKLNKRRKNDN